jgi:hypothetical protein
MAIDRLQLQLQGLIDPKGSDIARPIDGAGRLGGTLESAIVKIIVELCGGSD